MNNSQLPNDVYQTPSPQNGESFDAPEVNKTFHAIEREAVLQAFNQITQDLEMSISGYESREVAEVEVSAAHPIATELLHIGNGIKTHRERHHAALAEKSRLRGKIGHVIALLITNSPNDIIRPTKEKIIERESEIGAKLLPTDPDVIESKFFFLPSEDATTNQVIDMWHYDQKSTVRQKNFTNTYKIKETGIEKSSTFYDERIQRVVNQSSIPSEIEKQNLLMVSKKYYSAVTEKVYIKPVAPRFRFGSKSDHDLAA